MTTSADAKTRFRIDWPSLYKKDDWWAVWIGLLLFFVALPSYTGTFLLKWIPAGRSWVHVTQALGFGASGPANSQGWLALVALWILLLVLLLPVAKLTNVSIKSWLVGFSVIFWIGWLIWIGANYKPLVNVVGSSESGFVFILLAGIVIGNLPQVPKWLTSSAKSEFFIKTAIVLLGAKILLTTFATVVLPVLGAVSLAFPIVWIVAYILGRKLGLDQKFSAVLSSGVGVCGIAASIATASAIEAPPIYATMISSIIVVFSSVELLVMPYIASIVMPHMQNAAGVWMGLAVKTDGAATASGSAVSQLLGLGPSGTPVLMAVTTKVLLDVWIGLIAFILAVIFTYRIEKKPGQKASLLMIWYKFPKFVLGFFATSGILSLIALTYPTIAKGATAVGAVATFGTTPLQVSFFLFTFFSIGVTTRISALKQVGLRKPMLVYGVSLLFALIWGGILAFIFFGGMP